MSLHHHHRKATILYNPQLTFQKIPGISAFLDFGYLSPKALRYHFCVASAARTKLTTTQTSAKKGRGLTQPFGSRIQKTGDDGDDKGGCVLEDELAATNFSMAKQVRKKPA
mmetsp:Transcript_1550/g.2229  ORF Transcript_1550/g.2229 Transcript_1550/m.2229 type:complete len:111 (+) Transcript_1550:852-1184(+)